MSAAKFSRRGEPYGATDCPQPRWSKVMQRNSPEKAGDLLPPAHVVAAAPVGEDDGGAAAVGLVVEFYAVDGRFGHGWSPFWSF